ncbi:TFIIF beta subunit, HTH domain, partial [Dillenia turbinata]
SQFSSAPPRTAVISQSKRRFSRVITQTAPLLEGERMEEEQSNGKMDTGRADRSVWLMKCPIVVSKLWQSHASDSQPFAKVVLSVDPLRPPEDPSSLQFTMEMIGSDPGNVPKSYSLNMFKDFVPMCVFSETTQGRVSGDNPVIYISCSHFYLYESVEMILSYASLVPISTYMFLLLFWKVFTIFEVLNGGNSPFSFVGGVATEGKVEHKFDMKPHNENIEEYGKLCRERTNKSMIKTRQIQVIDNDRGVHMRPMPGMVGLNMLGSKDKKKATQVKQSDMKRTRRDRGELEDIMFNLFERQPNWALKQLVQETDQPAQFLKEILNELCVYNKRGTNQGTYELKPEYKKSVEDTAAE